MLAWHELARVTANAQSLPSDVSLNVHVCAQMQGRLCAGHGRDLPHALTRAAWPGLCVPPSRAAKTRQKATSWPVPAKMVRGIARRKCTLCCVCSGRGTEGLARHAVRVRRQADAAARRNWRLVRNVRGAQGADSCAVRRRCKGYRMHACMPVD